MTLADLRNEERLPELSIRGTTNYNAVFQDLLTRIPSDIAGLKGAATRFTGQQYSSSATGNQVPNGIRRTNG